MRGISLGVAPGECLGLLGPNGAGKTTTLSCLTAEIRPTGGAVYVCGHAVSGDGRLQAYRQHPRAPLHLDITEFQKAGTKWIRQFRCQFKKSISLTVG